MLRLLPFFLLPFCARAISLVKDLTEKQEDYWPHARGHPGRYSTTSHIGPADLNASLAWEWHHPEGRYHTTVVSGALLDAQKNVFIASEDGVRKFNKDGETLWYYPARGSMSQCPSLMNGALFGSTMDGWVFSLDMETGAENWLEKKADSIPVDTGYVESSEGIVVAGVDEGDGGGATRVLGIDSKDGRTIWEYRSDQQLWNIMPIFTGDDSWIVMDTHGSVQKHGLHNGTLLWKAEVDKKFRDTFSDGGVIVGPDGTSYTCSNYGHGKHGEMGALRAYRLQDGHKLWERMLNYPCNSWPVVSPDGKSVIVPAGEFVDSAAASDTTLLFRFWKTPQQMQEFSLSLNNSEQATYGHPPRLAAIESFDAHTGHHQWSTELPPYGRRTARGDEEGYLERKRLGIREQCLPAQFSAPTMSGDGTIYVGRADGLLYAVDSGTGKYQTFDTGAGFLHPGTSWAPGMMAVTSCDGLFVWNF